MKSLKGLSIEDRVTVQDALASLKFVPGNVPSTDEIRLKMQSLPESLQNVFLTAFSEYLMLTPKMHQ